MVEPVAKSSDPLLRRVFTDPHYAGYRYWHAIVMVFIIVSCISLALESVQDLSDRFATTFDWSEWITVVFFTLDALANLYFAPRPLRYLFSFWGVIDVISVVPSYLMLFNMTAVRTTKMIRLLRVARALRVLKLAKSARDDVDQIEMEDRNPILANLKMGSNAAECRMTP